MSQDRYRDIVAVAVTIAFIGLGVYFLSDSHSAASYTNTGAESRTAASACTRPKAVPMEPGNAACRRRFSSAITITGTPFPP